MWTARATSASFAACYQAAPRPPALAACSPVGASPQPRRTQVAAVEAGRGTSRRVGALEGGLRQRHVGGGEEDCSAEDAMLIEVAREWAHRHEAMQLVRRVLVVAGLDVGYKLSCQYINK